MNKDFSILQGSSDLTAIRLSLSESKSSSFNTVECIILSNRVCDCAGELLQCDFNVANNEFLSVLSEGGEGIDRIDTNMIPEEEVLCLWKWPNFYSGSHHRLYFDVLYSKK